jgi:Ca-activated chloride channel family protein
VHLAHPLWLVALLPLVLLIAAAPILARARGRRWSAFVADRLRRGLILSGSALPRRFALGFLVAACVLLVFALTRPYTESGVSTERTVARNVLVALDLSRSMRTADVKPDRLGQAKVLVHELTEAMPQERFGLIGFAGSAYVYAPLTIDHRAVLETTDQIDETWTSIGGSNIADALKLGISTLRKTGQRNNVLVLISDGEDHNGRTRAMIEEAKAAGVFILAVGVGTENGDYVPNPDFKNRNAPRGRMVDKKGLPVISRLKTDVLRDLADGTGGRFAILGAGTDIPAMVRTAVADMDAFEIEGPQRKEVAEHYQWLVLPAIVMLAAAAIASTRWRAVRHAAAAACAACALIPTECPADPVTDAWNALRSGRLKEAAEGYGRLAERKLPGADPESFRLGQGVAAYRSGDFKSARSAFSGAVLSNDSAIAAQGHAGMGNTAFQLGWHALAGQSYPKGPTTPTLEEFNGIIAKLFEEAKEALKRREADDGADQRKRDVLEILRGTATDWADAVRHYDSSLALKRDDDVALHNRALAMTYLKRLLELLDQEEQALTMAMAMGTPQAGAGGKEGDQEGDDDGEGSSGKRKKKGKGGDEKDRKGSGDRPEPEETDEPGGARPGESKEDRARRLLQENADRETGPPPQAADPSTQGGQRSSGQVEQVDPEKDW